MKNFKIGDKVKIVDTGWIYFTYPAFFSENNLPKLGAKYCYKYPENLIDKSKTYTVKYVNNHGYSSEIVVVIQHSNYEVYLINPQGLKLITQKYTFIEAWDIVEKEHDKQFSMVHEGEDSISLFWDQDTCSPTIEVDGEDRKPNCYYINLNNKWEEIYVY